MSLFPDPEQLENKTHGNRPSQNARSSGMWKKAMKSVARSIYRNPKKVFLGAILGYVFIQGDKLPEDMMLEIPFSQFENLEQNPIKPSLYQTLRAIDYAGRDTRVKGILARFSDFESIGFADAAEIAKSIRKFNDTGKKTIIFADEYSGKRYLIGSAFQDVHILPLGHIDMQPRAMRTPFFASLFENIGITFQVFQRKEYKSAGEQFARTHFSDAARRQMTSILNETFENAALQIAEHRQDKFKGIDLSEFISNESDQNYNEIDNNNNENGEKSSSPSLTLRSVLLAGELSSARAFSLGFVDQESFIEDIRDDLKEEFKSEKSKLKFVPLQKYVARLSSKTTKSFLKEKEEENEEESNNNNNNNNNSNQEEEKNKDIIDKDDNNNNNNNNNNDDDDDDNEEESSKWSLKSSFKFIDPSNIPDSISLLSKKPSILILSIDGVITPQSERSFQQKCDRIEQLKHNAGVVVRINSPGGGVAPSLKINNHIARLRRKGIPVVVSQGNVCASGGYMAAVAGDKIFSNPFSITGSVGVIAMFPVAQELIRRAGVSIDDVRIDGAADELIDVTQEVSEDRRRRLDAMLDESYERFVQMCAESRGMEYSEMEQNARGQVMLGKRSVERGMSDRIGGLQEAIAHAKSMMMEKHPEIPDPASINVLEIRTSFWSQLQSRMDDTSAMWRTALHLYQSFERRSSEMKGNTSDSIQFRIPSEYDPLNENNDVEEKW